MATNIMMTWSPSFTNWRDAFRKIAETPFWQDAVAAHPWRAAAVAAATLVLVCAAAALADRRREKILASDRNAVAARRACEYYRNKARPPEIRMTTEDKEQFKRCDPLRDGLVPKTALAKMAWDWCYCRYVASLIKSDEKAMSAKTAKSPRHVRRTVKKLYRDALEDTPDLCRIWLAYVDKKGRQRSEYRFTYQPEEVLEAAGPETCNAVKALMKQSFKCAACGKDPDDGDPYEWDNGTARTICSSCAVSKAASENIKAAMEAKSGTTE